MEKFGSGEKSLKFGLKEAGLMFFLMMGRDNNALASIPKSLQYDAPKQVETVIDSEISKIKLHILALTLQGNFENNYGSHELGQPRVEDFLKKDKSELQKIFLSLSPNFNFQASPQEITGQMNAFLEAEKELFLKNFQEVLQSNYDFSNVSLEQTLEIAQEIVSANPDSELLNNLLDALWAQIKAYSETETEVKLYLADRLNALEKFRVETAYPFLKTYSLIKALTSK